MKRAAALRHRSRASVALPDRPRAESSAHQAAGHDSTMLNWYPLPGSADADLLPDLDMLVPRSRDLARNNGLMAGATQTFKDNIIGSVLRLSALPDFKLLGWDHQRARAWGNAVEAEFRSFADTTECDAGNSLTLLGLTLQALGGAIGNGEALALPIWDPRPGARWATRIMMIESDRLSTPDGMESQSNLRGGVEINPYGAPIAYHIRNTHPGDQYGFGLRGLSMIGAAAPTWERIEAYTSWGRRRVLHLHDKERTGQSRGKPLVTAVMREFHMAGKYSSTELQAAVANSLIAAFLESDLDPDSAARLFGEEPRDAWATSVGQTKNIRQLQGASVIPLPAGARLSSFTPGRPNAAFEAFMHATLRHIAAGINIPYELLLKDFSQTNYSSARAALLEAWRYFHGRRRWLVDYWLRPIYELWLEEAINVGRVEAPGFYENRYAYTRCRFIFAGRGWVDPTKEAQAAQLRMQIGVSTLEAECAEQGLDWEEVLQQRSLEQQRLAELGLSLDPADASASAEDPMNGDQAEPKQGAEGASKMIVGIRPGISMQGAPRPRPRAQPRGLELGTVLSALAEKQNPVINVPVTVNHTPPPPPPPPQVTVENRLEQAAPAPQPAPVVEVHNHVQPTPVQVDVTNQVPPTPVQVAVTNDVQPAAVQVAVTNDVQPAAVQVSLPPRRTDTTVERDANGDIVKTTQVETTMEER